MSCLKKLVFAVLLLLLIPSIYAAELEIEYLPVRDSVVLGEQAAFDVRITNNQEFKDTFRFSYTDLFWDILSDPLHHYFSGVDILSGNSQTVRLLLNTREDLEFGQYKIDVTVRSEKGKNSEEMPLFITVRPEKPLIREYLAAVHRIVEISPVIYPNENASVKINLINRNPKNLSNVKVILSSELLNKEIQTSLEPLETKVVEAKFSLDPLTFPQKDVLNVKLMVDGAILEPEINEPYELGAYSEIIADSLSTKKLFFKTIEETKYTNNGNVKNSKTIEIETNQFREIFSKATPEPFSIKKGETQFIAWEISLEPAESMTITRTVSYRSLFVLAFIIAAVIALYFFLRSPVYAVKKASISTLKEGGISELKIIVHLKNRSNQPYERITVTDRIPTAADVTTGTDLGTVKPSSIYNDGKKTIVKWELKKLEKNEERILSYQMKSKLAILGSVTLPGVAVRFYTIKGTKLVTRSKQVTVSV
ncbi:hypothetical protein CMO88_01580 [Candidatus Woesearchaeota archaeon]|nr:hypothetical protein [Candidatus Woesearchaeota archaeon]